MMTAGKTFVSCKFFSLPFSMDYNLKENVKSVDFHLDKAFCTC